MVNLKRICVSALNLKIISFFHENPSTVDTSRGIAAWLNHDRKEIKKALDFLASQGILTAHRTGSTVAYAYTQDKKTIEGVEKFLQNQSRRDAHV
jgi:DNA-binding GntR family transcriptional regulator